MTTQKIKTLLQQQTLTKTEIKQAEEYLWFCRDMGCFGRFEAALAQKLKELEREIAEKMGA